MNIDKDRATSFDSYLATPERREPIATARMRQLGAKILQRVAKRLTRPFRHREPGDPVSLYTLVDDSAEYDLSKTGGIVKSISETTPLDLLGGTISIFSPEEAKEIIMWIENERDSSPSEKPKKTA